MTSSKWSLTVGRAHPAGHGPIALLLTTDAAETIIEQAIPQIYPMHRGVEKLFESRTYQQLLSLANRHDWLSSFNSELGLALLVEQELGMAVPVRAQWIRTMMAELNRAIHHIRWLGESVPEISNTPVSATVHTRARATREYLVDLHERASGGRLHPMLVTYGGLRADLPSDWHVSLTDDLASVRDCVAELTTWWESQEQLRGVGVLPSQTASDYATSGPVARASGFGRDLRFDAPYVRYDELTAAGVLTRVTDSSGDAYSRFRCLARELAQSVAAVEYCSRRLTEPELSGPVNIQLPRTLRVPEGISYDWTESPTGINGWLLVSAGGVTPERLFLRSASFANAQALCQILTGTRVCDLPATLMSFCLVSGDLAK